MNSNRYWSEDKQKWRMIFTEGLFAFLFDQSVTAAWSAYWNLVEGSWVHLFLSVFSFFCFVCSMFIGLFGHQTDSHLRAICGLKGLFFKDWYRCRVLLIHVLDGPCWLPIGEHQFRERSRWKWIGFDNWRWSLESQDSVWERYDSNVREEDTKLNWFFFFFTVELRIEP